MPTSYASGLSPQLLVDALARRKARLGLADPITVQYPNILNNGCFIPQTQRWTQQDRVVGTLRPTIQGDCG
jgi:hypothetical protein